MKEGLPTEGLRRQEDYENLEERMSAQMEEGFKNEENARKLVRNELAVMKDEIKNLEMGSGGTVSSEASTGVGLGSGTFARPPPLTSRWNEFFVLRKMEFRGWVTGHTQSSIQGITDDEGSILVKDLERMVPRQAHKRIDSDQTRKEHGTWPTKPMVKYIYIDLYIYMRRLGESRLQDSRAECEESLEAALNKGTSFVLQRTPGNERR